MLTTTKVTVRLDAEGWYVATSDELPGLFWVDKDWDNAEAEIAFVIKTLLELDHGLEIKSVYPIGTTKITVDTDSILHEKLWCYEWLDKQGGS